MITNKEKKLALSCGKKFVCIITQNIIENKGNFYCLNCLHSFRTENKLKCHEKVCKNIYFFGIVVPPENGNILEFNKCRKSDKLVHIFYPALESLIKEIDLQKFWKNLQQQKQENIFLTDIQCQRFEHLIIQKTRILYIVVKIV